MLLGRELEQRAVDRTLASARSGRSAVLALLGEPGIGKTALLGYARQRAHGLRVLGAHGTESETQLPFAALSELLRPALGLLPRIPPPQALALEGALALREARAVERFAVGVATLSLLAACADEDPLLLLIDDAHLLDAASAQALAFALRRLLAEPIAAILCARSGEPSMLDDSDLPTIVLEGLAPADAAELLGSVSASEAGALHSATAGNPLALLELREEAGALPPFEGPVRVSARISRSFARRADALEPDARRLLIIAAASFSGELATLARAAATCGIEISELDECEATGLLRRVDSCVEFRHPLARSAVYSEARPRERRAAHRALADALPDHAADERAWQLALAAAGTDEDAAAALEQAASRARSRGAFAVAAAALERAASLAADPRERERLLVASADSAWTANEPERALSLLARASDGPGDPELALAREILRGRITTRCGPVPDGLAALAAVAEGVCERDPDEAVDLFAEAVEACFYVGDADAMRRYAERAQELARSSRSPRARFLAATSAGMAGIFGGQDDCAGVDAMRNAVAIAESEPELQCDARLLPWLVMGPLWLRESDAGTRLVAEAQAARAQASVGVLPWLLNRIARHHAGTDSWRLARVEYDEAIALARESGQRTELAGGLAGLAWMEAREGREADCRAHVEEALGLCARLGAGLFEIWAVRALAELELAAGRAQPALAHFERVAEGLERHAISDVDIDPTPEIVECRLRLGDGEAAAGCAVRFNERAQRKGQPWALARALRVRALVAGEDDFEPLFDEALCLHARSADTFETARTHLAFGSRLRRSRRRGDARVQLRGALADFERLDARPWAGIALGELAATGERARRRDPSTLDELTNQELQIAHLLADGATTREAAASLFLSPKTIEYHLRSIYRKLGVKTRADLPSALARP